MDFMDFSCLIPSAEKDVSRRLRRESARKHRNAERTKTMSFQRAADAFKRTTKKKGRGRAMKMKGETMPTQISSNGIAKGWVKAFGGRETFKTAYVWAVT